MYRLKKSLGQHFLKDETIIQRIINSLREQPFDRLLEVGPGGGALTLNLAAIDHIEFLAVEVDEEKVDYLKSKLPKLQLIHGDFLKMGKPFDLPFTVVGNFPYNISSQVLFKIIEWFPAVERVIGMFQKEVAARVAAKEGGKDYGVPSVLVQYYYTVQPLFEVPPRSFVPPPKVESTVIALEKREQLFPVKSEAALRMLVKTAFGHRRKKLRNNLKGIVDAEILADSLGDRRAETLSVQEFAELTFEMR